MTTLEPLSGKDPEDYRLLYSIYTHDIRFAKQQQWRITYYAFILMSGIYYIRTHNQSHLFWHIFLQIILLIIAFTAVYFVLKIENRILRYRCKIKQVVRQQTYT